MSPGGMGPYPRGPPVANIPFRDREPDWRARGLMPVGAPRPYPRDLRQIRKGLHPVRDEGPPRRLQKSRGPPAPTVDRYKSQSR